MAWAQLDHSSGLTYVHFCLLSLGRCGELDDLARPLLSPFLSASVVSHLRQWSKLVHMAGISGSQPQLRTAQHHFYILLLATVGHEVGPGSSNEDCTRQEEPQGQIACCCTCSTVVAVRRGYSLVAVCRLLIAVSYCRAQALGHMSFSCCSTWAQ